MFFFSFYWQNSFNLVTLGFFQFDWEGDLPLKYPQKDLIIYEMHVRGFTRHESSRTKFPGTYHGVMEKLDHLKVLVSVHKSCLKIFEEVLFAS